MDLVLQRCSIHRDREAVVRCPGCAGYFCRECVTEHEGKFLCSSCLQRNFAPPRARGQFGGRIAGAFALITGFAIAWFLFYIIGRLLILVPPNLHELHYLNGIR
jgi:hypothetical protein